MTADPIELKWRKGDPDECLKIDISHPWATFDPGSCGVGLIFRPLATWESCEPFPARVVPVKGRHGATRFADRCEGKVRLIIVEEPFVGRENVQSALTTARSAAFLPGAMQAMLGNDPLTIISVPAQSWQASEIPRSLGERVDRKKAAGDMADATMADDSRWLAASKGLREAIADALLMAKWWARLRRPSLFTTVHP